MRILWDSGNVGFGGCGINEWDRNVVSCLREQGHDVILIVDELLSRRPKFKKWNPPEGGYSLVKEKITPSNYRQIVDSLGHFDFQIGNHFTMFPVLENLIPICHDFEIPGRRDYSNGIKWSAFGLRKLTSKFACTTPFIEEQVKAALPGTETVSLFGGSKFVPMKVVKEGKPYISYWGNRYSKEKNFLALLKTLPHHDLDLVVCSFLPPKAEELKLLEDLNCEHRVTFKTGLSDTELNRVVAGSYLYVCPSTYEGFGLPVVEAMAAGVPVVVAPCSALPSVGGDSVLVAKSHKTQHLLEGILHVKENYDESLLKVEKGFERVKKWTWSNTAKSLIAFCEKE